MGLGSVVLVLVMALVDVNMIKVADVVDSVSKHRHTHKAMNAWGIVLATDTQISYKMVMREATHMSSMS